MPDILEPIKTRIKNYLAQNNGSANIFEVLRDVESEIEWVSMLYINQAVTSSSELIRQGNTVFLQQEITETSKVRVEKAAQPLFPGEWQFIDDDDVADFKRWMEERFQNYLQRNNAKEKEEARDLLEKVRLLSHYHAAELDIATVEALWDELDEFDKAYNLNNGLVWGLWRIERERISDSYRIGNTECQLIYPANGTTTIHEYRRQPGKLKWQVLPVEQEGATFYIGVAPVKEIDAVSAVPDLPESMTCERAAKRVLDNQLGMNEWQRQLSVKRREAIMQFMEHSESVLANAPLLFVFDDERVTFSNRSVEIDLSWLVKQSIERNGQRYEAYRDVISEGRDNRPLWLIDGQHRIRGGAGSKRGREVAIPIIIFPNDFKLKNTAKIFAEINTLQEGLDEFHSLFMQHRFHSPSPNVTRDFRVNEDGEPSTADSQANHWSYQLAANLCNDPRSPLFDRIRFLKQNESIKPVVKATQWVDFSRSWVKSIYVEDAFGSTLESCTLEVGNYFKAFERLYTDKPNPGWSRGNRKSLIQGQTHFIALLLAYPRVREHALIIREGGSGLLNEPEFHTAMLAWQNIDWWDRDMEAAFGGGGEKPRRSLLAWLQDAIGAEPGKRTEIHNDTHQSVAGRSLFAKPAQCEIEKRGNNWMTHAADYMRFRAERPINALPTVRWELEDLSGTEIESGSAVCRDGHIAEWKIRYSNAWNRHSELIMVAKWDNVNGASTTQLKLRRH